jgi:murein DD-endopeptidase MepM/ murein hydrolase activator NlpD
MRALLALVVAAGLFALPTTHAAAGSDDPQFVMLAYPQAHPRSDLRDSYGARRSGGRRHQGNDLMGEKMWPVVAVADGFVTVMKSSGRAGCYVVLGHAGGWETKYMHLNNDTPGTDDRKGVPRYSFAPGVEVGAFVAAGQLIGWTGDSGNAEGSQPHLHFELLRDGRHVDPYPYLADAWERQLRAWKLAAHAR